ncbi:hypothetical protein TNIN_404871 [Trichonephila inaurata madagascariensis]|uniref:Uncharacterized protein n=1 Tax=Trichonephila inaurata madagascariensis TaxID=2747483 RepID=A0A8X6XQH9_9ARAC|nr:hypothetical protein TNIN_404871 [Trichonephila inaurata madagascariensis]
MPAWRILKSLLLGCGDDQEAVLRLYFPKIMSSTSTTDIEIKVGRLPRNRYVLQTPSSDPLISRGNDTSRKVSFYPLLLVRCSLSNTLARPCALTCTLKASTRSRCAGHSDTHSTPFTEQRKGCKPCQRAQLFSRLRWYIKVALFLAKVR